MNASILESGHEAAGVEGMALSSLEAWLGEQCPDTATVRLTNTQTQESLDLTCAEARAQILASASLLSLDEASPARGAGPEPVGEAAQRWSPAGVICSILMAALAAGFNWPWGQKGCNDPRAEHPDACKVTTSVVPAVVGIACAFL